MANVKPTNHINIFEALIMLEKYFYMNVEDAKTQLLASIIADLGMENPTKEDIRVLYVLTSYIKDEKDMKKATEELDCLRAEWHNKSL